MIAAGSAGVQLDWRRRDSKKLLFVQLLDSSTQDRLTRGLLHLLPGGEGFLSNREHSWHIPVGPGKYVVAAVCPGYAPMIIKLEVHPGEGEIHEVRALARRGRQITGRVVSDDAIPLARAGIVLMIETGTTKRFHDCRAALTGLDGSFLVVDAPHQGGWLKVVARGHVPAIVPITSEDMVVRLKRQR